MPDVAIRAEGLGKLYRLGGAVRPDARLGERLLDIATAALRRVGRRPAVPTDEAADRLWALRDVSFAIERGDVVGVIGNNGAGKSTLLKILSRITDPSEGWVDVAGRVGSLLEVGTGFHPELTGRQNVFLNGALLGMRKAEIERKFDAMVAFSEIGRFIDTPVKHYSSGMYVRLAFAVAAHLEPEILLIDEILAVGDIGFQKKCLRAMDDVSRRGRTVVFVSHNLNAVQRLCPKSMLLEHGRVVAFGATPDVVRRYLEAQGAVNGPGDWIDLRGMGREGTRQVRFAAVSFTSGEPSTARQAYPHGPLEIRVEIDADAPRVVGSVAVTLSDRHGTKLINADTLALGEGVALAAGRNVLRFRIDELHLNPGPYVLALWAADPPAEIFDRVDAAAVVDVVEREAERIRVADDGLVPCRFRVERES